MTGNNRQIYVISNFNQLQGFEVETLLQIGKSTVRPLLKGNSISIMHVFVSD